MRGEALPPLGGARSPLGKLARGGSRVRRGRRPHVTRLAGHGWGACIATSPAGPQLKTPSASHPQDCGAAATAPATAPPLLPEGSDGLLSVSRSALSGSSKAPFPPDRSFVNDFDWTKNSRWVWVGVGRQGGTRAAGAGALQAGRRAG